ncbi:MAG: class I SAM-dependent methyltransferase [Sarcina sp.]
MKFFMKEENVDKYIEMIKDYDGSSLIAKVKKYLKEGSTLLELGMGTGGDLDILAKNYKVVGSDNSNIFIDKYKEKSNKNEVINLDVMEMNIDRKFDCIYSNKVMHHLTRENFIKSMKKQKNNLSDDGIIFMTLWRGEYKEKLMYNDEIRFTYYLESDIKNMIDDDYIVVNIETYTEFEESKDDSLLVVLKRK